VDRRVQRRVGRGRCGPRRAPGQERDPADGDLGRTQGEIRYWLRIADGSASTGLGDADDADVTIGQSYETSALVNKGELDGQKAFMQGKVKISGKMLTMMQLRGPLEKVQAAPATIDTEY
jgi:putative sterol carrier protein